MNPPLEPMEEEKIAHVFCFAAISDVNTGTIYINNARKFPVRSLEGHIYIFVLYNYSTNAILVEPLQSMESKEFVATFQKKMENLTKKGFKPKFNVIDNIVSKAVRECLEENEMKMQIVQPNNHRVNAAERAIQTFKNI